MTQRSTSALVSLALALTVSACGTRLSEDEIVSSEGARVAAQAGVVGATDAAVATPVPGSTGSASATVPGRAPGPVGGPATVATPAGEARAGGARVAGNGTTKGSSSRPGAGTAVGGTHVGQAVSCGKSGPPIKLGQIGTFSGFIATSVGQARRAMQVWVSYQNEHGGVACHPIQLTQLDDQSDPTKAYSAAKSLINDTKVASLVGVFSPVVMSGVKEGVSGTGVPVVGGDGANPIWTSTPGIYDVGAAINSQIFLLNKAAADAGRKKVAIFYCVEGTSCTSAGAVAAGDGEYSAKAAGQQVVYKASISVTQPDFTAQCQSAKNAGADNLFIATESTSLTRFMQSCDSLGYYPHITTCGICMGFDVTNKTLQKFQVTAATPVFPYMRTQSVAEQTFAAAFKKYSPGQPPDHISAQTWTAGMMLQRALELLGPQAQLQEITPAMVLKGLGMVKAETLGGLVAPTTYSPNQSRTSPNPCGSVLLFDTGRWIAATTKNDGWTCVS